MGGSPYVRVRVSKRRGQSPSSVKSPEYPKHLSLSTSVSTSLNSGDIHGNDIYSSCGSGVQTDHKVKTSLGNIKRIYVVTHYLSGMT